MAARPPHVARGASGLARRGGRCAPCGLSGLVWCARCGRIVSEKGAPKRQTSYNCSPETQGGRSACLFVVCAVTYLFLVFSLFSAVRD